MRDELTAALGEVCEPVTGKRGRQGPVLVAVEPGEPSLRGVREAIRIAGAPSRVRLLCVLPELRSDVDHIRAALAPGGDEARDVAALRWRLRERGWDRVGVVLRIGRTQDVVPAAAAELGCNLIVLPLPRRRFGLPLSFGRPLVDAVARRAPCPVIVLPPERRPGDFGLAWPGQSTRSASPG